MAKKILACNASCRKLRYTVVRDCMAMVLHQMLMAGADVGTITIRLRREGVGVLVVRATSEETENGTPKFEPELLKEGGRHVTWS